MAQLQVGVPYTDSEQDSLTTTLEAINAAAEDAAVFDPSTEATDLNLVNSLAVSTSGTIAPTSLIFTLLVTTGASTSTQNLPSAATEREINIVKVDAGVGTVVVTAASGQTINGAATYTVTSQWESVTLVADGATGWKIKDRFCPAAPKISTVTKTVGVSGSGADYECDGVADQVQINAALAGGGHVHLTGHFYISATIYLFSNTQVTMTKGSLIESTAADFVMLRTTKSGTAKNVYSDIVLDGLKIKSNKGHITVLSNITGLVIKNCEMYFDDISQHEIRESLCCQHCQNVIITENYLHNLTGNGVQVNGCDYFVVANNIVDGGTYADDLIDIDKDFLDTKTVYCHYGTVIGNVVRNGDRGNGIRVASTHNCIVVGNTVSNITTPFAGGILVNGYTGDLSSNDSSNIAVVGNVVSDCDGNGIYLQEKAPNGWLTQISVNNNTISNCGFSTDTVLKTGILINSENVVVTNNNIYGCGTISGDSAGILNYKANHVYISNNFVENCITGIRFWNGSETETYSDCIATDNIIVSYTNAVISAACDNTCTIHSNTGDNSFVIDGINHKVGIGTTSPVGKLDVDYNASSSSSISGLIVDVDNASTGGAVGVDIFNITATSGTVVGERIAAPSGGTANMALQLSDTSGIAAGGITFGTDTTLYRSAADTLKTDDALVVSGKITSVSATPINLSTASSPAPTDSSTAGDLKINEHYIFYSPTTSSWKRTPLQTYRSSASKLPSTAVSEMVYAQDFINSGQVAPWTAAAISSGTATQANGTEVANHPGVVTLSSSTSANSGYKYFMVTGGTMYVASGAETECIFQPKVLTDTVTRIGFANSSDSTAVTNGIFINVANTVLSGKVVAASSETSTSTTCTVSVNTWYRARLQTLTGASTLFELSDCVTGTVLWTETLSAALPTSTLGHGVVTYNSGTTQQTLTWLDYLAMCNVSTLTR